LRIGSPPRGPLPSEATVRHLSRSRWLRLAALGGLVVPLSVGLAGAAQAAPAPAPASMPPTSELTVPSAVGQTVSDTWKGTIPVGSNPTSTCMATGANDNHDVKINVPAGVYANLIADVTFKITWVPGPGGETLHDEILTVRQGPAVLGSSDTSTTTETVTTSNPDPPATSYTVQACGFANASPQDYEGSVTITTKAIPAAADLPLADPQGLQFSATVASDPQRDEGEPAVTTDRAGNVYTCGPSGFSNIADYAQISTDGGDQFHLLGTPPRGQISTPPDGGGDCALGTSPVPNKQGKYTLAYAGLGPLTNFSTFTSADAGRTLRGDPISQSVPGVDRQWIAFTDASTAFLNYNSTTLGQTVQKSTDGGFSYATPGTVAATDGGRIGQIRTFQPAGTGTDKTKAFVYFPYNNGNLVKIALSKDGGTTFSQCTVIDAGIDPTAGFIVADNDTAGNVYVTYSEKGGGRDTYLVSIPASKFAGCDGGDRVLPKLSKLQVNRGDAQTTLFPWVAAGGQPGKVAVAFYGTPSVGDPDSGQFKAAWNVYVSQVLDAFGAQPPAVAEVKATTHPFHYDSICTAGLGCTINGADRSLVDYFTIEYNRSRKTLQLVYSQANKKPDETEGHVATPAVVSQVAGPSNGGGAVDGGFRKNVLRTTSPDPAGDAIEGYSVLNVGAAVAAPRNVAVPALDLMNRSGRPAVTVEPGRNLSATPGALDATGGFTVTMRYNDLSAAALTQAVSSGGTPGSLIYLYRFVDGYQSAGLTARYTPGTGSFSFGYNGYDTGSAQCGSSGEKCLIYPADKPIQGAVDQTAGTITLSVPRSYLTALGGPDSSGQRPTEVPATAGSRIYDATAFTLLNPSPNPDTQSFMEQIDNAPAMDFTLAGVTPTPSVPEARSAVLLPLLALATALGTVTWRRRRRATV